MNRVVPLVALALLAGGCVSLAPNAPPPEAPVDAAYPHAASPNAIDAAHAVPGWREFVGDPRLAALIERALSDNRDLRLAAANLERARFEARVALAERLPGVELGIDAQKGEGASSSSDDAFAGLRVPAFELDLFGRLRDLDRAARADYLASAAAAESVRAGLVAAVIEGWVEWQAASRARALALSTVASRSESRALAAELFDVGAASELDLAAADSLLEAARVVEARETRRLRVAANALRLLAGSAPDPADAERALPPLMAVAPGLPADLLTRRPDVREAERRLAAADARIGAARAAFFPRIALTAEGGVASPALDGLFDGRGAWRFVANLVQPIFDGGRLRGLLGIARADRDAAVARYEQTIRAAFRDVADALAGVDTLAEAARAQRAAAAAETRRAELVRLRFDAGDASRLETLDAERARFSAERDAIEAEAEVLKNRVALFAALGGGWAGACVECPTAASGSKQTAEAGQVSAE
ncbi:MAG: efflux transporter outer membrane subunit [Gammaproteobacteria bacterium]